MRYLLTILVSWYSLVSYAGTFQGERIQADITLPPAMEKMVMESLQYIETGLTRETFYQKIANNQNYTCLYHMDQMAVAPFIKTVQFDFTIKGDVLGDSVTASTTKSVVTINTNYKQTTKNWSNTLFHEMLHVVGFSHCGYNNPRFHKKILRSVPYQVGDYMEEEIESL